MADKILLRGDTKANWESVNPILSAKEMVIETDTNRTKIGDGAKTYTQLKYSSDAKKCIFRLNQTGTGAISFTEIRNDVGIIISTQYTAVGTYVSFLTGYSLPLTSTFFSISYNNINDAESVENKIGIRYESQDILDISSGHRAYSNGAFTLANNIISNAILEIIIY